MAPSLECQRMFIYSSIETEKIVECLSSNMIRETLLNRNQIMMLVKFYLCKMSSFLNVLQIKFLFCFFFHEDFPRAESLKFSLIATLSCRFMI